VAVGCQSRHLSGMEIARKKTDRSVAGSAQAIERRAFTIAEAARGPDFILMRGRVRALLREARGELCRKKLPYRCKAGELCGADAPLAGAHDRANEDLPTSASATNFAFGTT
jgi:hypothetical protein